MQSFKAADPTGRKKLSSLRQSDSTGGLKEQAEQALKQVNEDKDKFFRQVKLEFNQSKAELLDGFNRKSILYKIQSSTDSLQRSVVRRGSAKYVQLQADNAQNSADIINQSAGDDFYMFFSLTMRRHLFGKIIPPKNAFSTDDFSRSLINHYLGLKCMSFLFATVELLWFFWGRFMGVSVTSTTTTSSW